MDNEAILSMDPFILLSMLNMKLRDFYSSLNQLCDDLDVDEAVIYTKLKSIGYSYNAESNRFIAD